MISLPASASVLPDIHNLWALLLTLLLFLDAFPFFGLLIPGTACLLFGGGLIAAGLLSPFEAWSFSLLGALAGTGLGFALGRRGETLLEHCPWLSRPLSKLDGHISSLGKWGFLALRFSPWGCVYPFWSGLSGVTWLRFSTRALALHGVTTGLILTLGFYLANGLVLAAEWTTRFGFLSLFFLAFTALLFLAKWFLVKATPAFALLTETALSLGNHPPVKRFIHRHQRSMNFLRSRLKRNCFSGLPLTLLGVAFIYSLGFFLGIIQDLVFHDPLLALDSRLANLLAAFRDPSLMTFFRGVTLLGNWQAITAGILLTVSLLFLWNRRLYIIPFLTALFGCGLATSLLKNIVRRPRPFEMSAILKYSFPSGHSAFTACFYGFIFYIIAREFRRGRHEVDAFFAWLLLLSLVMFSRLYLGVHYLSDTLAGASLGTLWLLLGMSLSEWKRCHRQQPSTAPSRVFPGTKRAITGLFLSLYGLTMTLFLLTYAPPYAWQVPGQEETVRFLTIAEALQAKEMPPVTESILGNPTEPLSLVLLAPDRETVERAFLKAGWTVPEPLGAPSLFRALTDSVKNRSNPRAPMTPSFWNGRVNDLSFEKPTSRDTVRERHHSRFWKSGSITPEGMKIFVGTASLDRGIKWQRLVHHIDPDLDRERDLLVRDLTDAETAVVTREVRLIGPEWGKNIAGDIFFTDGRIIVLSVGNSLPE